VTSHKIKGVSVREGHCNFEGDEGADAKER
jgi:hypothetical protein